MEKQTHRISWFIIPAQDLDRACAFYESLFDEKLRRESMGPDAQYAAFPYEGNAISGCLMTAPDARPHTDGVRIYLETGRHGLDALLARAEALGGKVTTPPVQLPDGEGRYAHIRDCEGNIVGLHED